MKTLFVVLLTVLWSYSAFGIRGGRMPSFPYQRLPQPRMPPIPPPRLQPPPPVAQRPKPLPLPAPPPKNRDMTIQAPPLPAPPPKTRDMTIQAPPLPAPPPKTRDMTIQAPPLPAPPPKSRDMTKPSAQSPSTPHQQHSMQPNSDNQVAKRTDMSVVKVETPSVGSGSPSGTLGSRRSSDVSIHSIPDSIRSSAKTMSQQTPMVVMQQGKSTFWKDLALTSSMGTIGAAGQIASAGILAHSQSSMHYSAQQPNLGLWEEYYARLRENNATEEAWRIYNQELAANVSVLLPDLNFTTAEGTDLSIPLLSTTTAVPLDTFTISPATAINTSTLSPPVTINSSILSPPSVNTSALEDGIRAIDSNSRLYIYITVPCVVIIMFAICGLACCCCVFVTRDRKNTEVNDGENCRKQDMKT